MNHRGVEYSIARTEPGLWRWRFAIGESVTTGTTQTNLAGMAAHRVRRRINRALKTVGFAIPHRTDSTGSPDAR